MTIISYADHQNLFKKRSAIKAAFPFTFVSAFRAFTFIFPPLFTPLVFFSRFRVFLIVIFLQFFIFPLALLLPFSIVLTFAFHPLNSDLFCSLFLSFLVLHLALHKSLSTCQLSLFKISCFARRSVWLV